MAKRKINKSGAIRDYLTDHPEAGPTEVMAALAEKKIKVSATHVSNVKSRIASGASVGVRGVGRPRKNAADDTNLIPSAVNTVNELMKANTYANSVGGIQRGISILNVLAKIKA